ncbi:MAG: hypothetical protein PHY34_01950 [Patescibacteria group bacterium]|nr:hypothetical protein [Patescibacteria group bacterium]MDD5715302.1 hypothetical protein [Patescibacteria group bacterium]
MAGYAIKEVIDNSRHGKMSIKHDGGTFYVTKDDLVAGVTVLELAPEETGEMLERIGTKGCVLTVTAATRDSILDALGIPAEERESLATQEDLAAAALEVDSQPHRHSHTP